jgi:hypothetical protein
MRGSRKAALLAIAGIAALLIPNVGNAAKMIGPNIVNNPGFEAPAGGAVTSCGSGGIAVGVPGWGGFNNGPACTTTEVLPSTAPKGGAQMAHVVTANDSSGLVQCCYDIDFFQVRAAIKVNSGGAKVCVGVLGSPPCQLFYATPGVWQRMQTVSGDGSPGNPNEIVIYSIGSADFDVDLVSIREVTFPGV